MRSRLSLVSACVATLALASAASAEACVCTGESTAETYRDAQAAFTGRLIGVRSSSDGRFVIHRFRVITDYKRNLRDRIRVRTLAFSDCAIDARQPGRRYSMFLYRSEDGIRVTRTGPWTSNACLQTSRRAMRQAASDAEPSRSGGSGCTSG